MPSSNPIFARNRALNGRDPNAPLMTKEQLENLYAQPSAGPAQTGRMTYDDVMIKTGSLFAVLLAAAVVGWFVPALALPMALVGFVLGLVNAFKREPSPALIIIYAAAQGVFLGGISGIFEGMYSGIVLQAVIGTFSVFGVMLALFASGKIRVTPKFTKMLLMAVIGYGVFCLVNLGVMLFNPDMSMFGMRGIEVDLPIIGRMPLGIVIGVVAVVLAAFCLVMDFDMIQKGVQNGIPRKYAWTCAFGLMVTLIWLYIEILRILALFRGR
ncbi:Bax inhibitor-1/YccA family protein [Spelaeicoccus albus]|uniref:Putative YccA/Bax inhibitor family protein n=1 Tax=Spelaeicoccus albus TaxID=1280376 RepID=A0A7Z0D2Y3_9MICO|nr:Bax inhibitor-1/YccA family protein [Spelaeicoccus albus]NYI67905.1 putative YccA/Bax inhibitor family protein [Spelaeicoccus albus]